jgi:3-methyladenine DNA glycosylase AlkD
MNYTAKQILEELKPLGRESYKRVLSNNHGIKEPFFGVPISELKKFQKRIKKDYQLALDLYDTGNYDAMYLAGLIADDARMTRDDLQHWAEKAYARVLSGATVPWVAAESPHGREMALKWIDSAKALVAAAGWATLGSLVSIKDDAQLDLPELKRLMQRAQKSIHQAPDAVRSSMNAFLIAVGSYVQPLTEFALEIGEKIGPVTAELGDNDCRIPFAPDYIRKVEKRGTIGKKRKTAKC